MTTTLHEAITDLMAKRSKHKKNANMAIINWPPSGIKNIFSYQQLTHDLQRNNENSRKWIID